MRTNTLTPELPPQEWMPTGRAANYLSVGQIYLYDNPLLKEPLKLSHVKRWWSDIGAPICRAGFITGTRATRTNSHQEV